MISYAIGCTRDHGNVSVRPFAVKTRYEIERLRVDITDTDEDYSTFPVAAFAWLDLNAPLYHFEAIHEVVQAEDELFYQDWLSVLHVYEQNTAFMLRMQFDLKPMGEDWRERFLAEGFNSLYPGGGMVSPEYATILFKRWRMRDAGSRL